MTEPGVVEETVVAVGGLPEGKVELDDVPIELNHSLSVPSCQLKVSALDLSISA